MLKKILIGCSLIAVSSLNAITSAEILKNNRGKEIPANIKKTFEDVSNLVKVDKNILIKLSYLESSVTNYSVLINAKDINKVSSFLKNAKIKHKCYENYASIDISDRATADKFYFALKDFEKEHPTAIKTYDMGIMQINKENFKRYKVDEYKYYINPELNILLSGYVLKSCGQTFNGHFPKTIECYNKGVNESRFFAANYEYYRKYQKLKLLEI